MLRRKDSFWRARLDHTHCDSAGPLTDGLGGVCCGGSGRGGAMCCGCVEATARVHTIAKSTLPDLRKKRASERFCIQCWSSAGCRLPGVDDVGGAAQEPQDAQHARRAAAQHPVLRSLVRLWRIHEGPCARDVSGPRRRGARARGPHTSHTHTRHTQEQSL